MGEAKPKCQSSVWYTVKPFVNGRASGMLATCVIQPIDMVKTSFKIYLLASHGMPYKQKQQTSSLGFIAMYATLASRDVDYCLIPESPFYLEGSDGLLEYIEKRIKENGHMVQNL